MHRKNSASSTQIRPRLNTGTDLIPRDAGDGAVFVKQYRLCLSMEYKRSDLIMKGFPASMLAYGAKTRKSKKGRFALLNEAWLQLPFGNGFSLKRVGNNFLTMTTGSLGTLDWNTSGRWHDALKVGYENKIRSAHLLLAYNQKK